MKNNTPGHKLVVGTLILSLSILTGCGTQMDISQLSSLIDKNQGAPPVKRSSDILQKPAGHITASPVPAPSLIPEPTPLPVKVMPVVEPPSDISEEHGAKAIPAPQPKPTKMFDLTSNYRSAFQDTQALEHMYHCSYINADGLVSLGGLEPKIPIAECTESVMADKKTPMPPGIKQYYSFYGFHGLRYLIRNGATTQMISSMEEFKAIFAPVETESEALSFLKASPLMHVGLIDETRPLKPSTLTKPLADFIAQTTIERVENGFQINHAVIDGPCSQGRYLHYAVNYRVTREGDIEELSRKPLVDVECPVE